MGVFHSWSRKNDALRALHIPRQRHFGETLVPAASGTQSSFFQPPEPQEQLRKAPFLWRICISMKKVLFLCTSARRRGFRRWTLAQVATLKTFLQRAESALNFSLHFAALSNLFQGLPQTKKNSPELRWTPKKGHHQTLRYVLHSLISLVIWKQWITHSKSLRASNSGFSTAESQFLSLWNQEIEDLQGFGYGKIDAGVKWVLLMSLWWAKY